MCIGERRIYMAFFLNFKRSALELKSLRCLTTTAILIALDVALKFFTINMTETLKISFAFVALAAIGMLFGPVVAGIAGVVTDVVGYFVMPSGGFNPLFTIVEMTGAVIYGIFLYNLNPLRFDGKQDFTKKNVFQALRIVFGKLTVVVVCNLILTPLALIMSGYNSWESMIVKYPLRVIKNMAQFPIDVLILFVVLPGVMFAYKQASKQITKVRGARAEKS